MWLRLCALLLANDFHLEWAFRDHGLRFVRIVEQQTRAFVLQALKIFLMALLFAELCTVTQEVNKAKTLAEV